MIWVFTYKEATPVYCVYQIWCFSGHSKQIPRWLLICIHFWFINTWHFREEITLRSQSCQVLTVGSGLAFIAPQMEGIRCKGCVRGGGGTRRDQKAGVTGITRYWGRKNLDIDTWISIYTAADFCCSRGEVYLQNCSSIACKGQEWIPWVNQRIIKRGMIIGISKHKVEEKYRHCKDLLHLNINLWPNYISILLHNWWVLQEKKYINASEWFRVIFSNERVWRKTQKKTNISIIDHLTLNRNF